jgi:hypothetical protein
MIHVPRGYRGIHHETLGKDFLALHGAVLMPDQILGKDVAARLRAKQPEAWYPIDELVEALEQLGRKLGADSLRKVGQSIFNAGPARSVKDSVRSAHALLHGFDRLYHRTNRGIDIGGWAVLQFEPGKAILEKTSPHHCSMEEGIVDAALRTINTPSTIHQSACLRAGADACRFVITSHVVDRRWTG